MLRISILFLLIAPFTATAIWGNTLCEKPFPADPCDSLYLTNGTVFAIKNLQTGKNEITFSFCDDTANQIHTAPWMQMRQIKKADGERSFRRLFPYRTPHRMMNSSGRWTGLCGKARFQSPCSC